MAGGIEIRELIFRASVEEQGGKEDNRRQEVIKTTGGISHSLRESIIRECMDRMKAYLEEKLER